MLNIKKKKKTGFYFFQNNQEPESDYLQTCLPLTEK